MDKRYMLVAYTLLFMPDFAQNKRKRVVDTEGNTVAPKNEGLLPYCSERRGAGRGGRRVRRTSVIEIREARARPLAAAACFTALQNRAVGVSRLPEYVTWYSQIFSNS
ncbi:hypothetical protein EVAR_54920_1 [Eumeta japonica]|uniref:Uncharacterized protein n=1 Tax=Eumeta variegata TaxID=151549 RepID=A0A4C1YFG9_EUMVA|nr:hypothetical protein EVAR_54920_1 [Eumeta japonica]